MRAIKATRFGGPDVLELTDVPDPVPGPGELLIDVAAAGVLWLDVQVRKGDGPAFIAAVPPYVPGGALAGVVRSTGERVVTRGPDGGYAEQVVVQAEDVVHVPDALGLPAATALMDDGTTAVALLERTPVRAGEWVLVQPALGGLGSLLLQSAVAEGARVVAAARGEHKLTLAKELGAEAVADYDDPQWTEQVRALTGGGVQVAFDGIGGATGLAAAAVVVDGGRFCSYGVAGGEPARVRGRGLTVAPMEQLAEFWPDQRRNLERALTAAAEGRMRPVIGMTYPLADAAQAHRDIEERRTIGKSLLVM
jgi:NADPH:quinone reductase-like Zn-dependent oxidoreductase